MTDRRVSGIHDRASRVHLTQPAGTGSKMGDKPPFTSGPGAVPTYTGTGAVPRQYLSPRGKRGSLNKEGQELDAASGEQ
jgi:hypothetical protein